MHIVIYTKLHSRAYRRLNRAIASIDLGGPVAVYEDMNLFCQHFRTMAVHPDVIILMPDSPEELDTLLQFRELLMNEWIIMILPDGKGQSLAKAHKFHSRYITFEDDEFKEVAEIIDHMKNNTLSIPILPGSKANNRTMEA